MATTMLNATARVEPWQVIAPVDRRLFGAFVEHMGRCVYTGIYEPGHPTADEDGFRADVLELVRELGVTVVRYPGGNFVSGYRWEDGVGPKSERPTRLDLAWRTIETNEFGLDEFMRWVSKAGIEPMLAFNLGTRGMQEALDLIEYCNHPSGTTLSDRRISHGATDPYGVRIWCLGNEMDGPWQLGHKTAHEYARLATETARALRQFDPTLELVACGSSGPTMPTFGEWEATVLEEAFDVVDYISLHAYYEETNGDLASFLGSADDLDRFIERVVATVDDVAAKRQSTKRIGLSVDEWNVWYLSKIQAADPNRPFSPTPRLSEEPYTVADAVVVGNLLISLLRHADRVTCASLAQLVNTIAPIHAEPGGQAWRKSTFYPFSLTAANARGSVVGLRVASPMTSTKKYGEIAAVDAVATLDAEAARLAVFAVNRSPTEPIELMLDLSGLGAIESVHVQTLSDADPHAANTADDPGRLEPAETSLEPAADGLARLTLPPVSWSAIAVAFSPS